MLGTVFYAIALLLIIIGLFFIFSLIISSLLCSHDEGRLFTLIYCDGDYDKLYERVYTAFYGCDFFSVSKKRDIIVIGDSLPKRVRLQCRDITEPFGRVYFLENKDIFFPDEAFFH